LERNSSGGLLYTTQDVATTLGALTGTPGSAGISCTDLLQKLKVFDPTVTLEDLKFLTGGEPTLTRGLLETLLVDNKLHMFDPLEECLPCFGPKGCVDEARLRALFTALGYKPFLPLEWRTLLEEVDVDRDGKVGLEDLRKAMAVARASRGGV
jgi:hypothetical protein